MDGREGGLEERPRSRVGRARPFLLGLLLSIPVAWLCVMAPQSAFFSMPVAPISILICLLIINIPLRLWAPKFAFSQGDLIIIFAIASVTAAISGEWGRIGQNHTYIFAAKAGSDPTAKNSFL